MTSDNKSNIVLVHGAWADGSSWSAVIEQLQAAGHEVTAPQFGMGALAEDVARLTPPMREARRRRPKQTRARSEEGARPRRGSRGRSYGALPVAA